MNKKSLTRLALGGIMAGGMLLTGCENSTDPAPASMTTKSITAAKTLAEFTEACKAIGGEPKSHDCRTQNTCAGHSFKDGVVSVQSCTGKSTCVGANCKEPAAK